MNEGERQKFEAELRAHWMPAATLITGLGYLDLVEKLWQLARAKQSSQTRAAAVTCVKCGLPDDVIAHHPLRMQKKAGTFYHEFEASAVPVEDRPAPTPKYDKECLTCCAREAHTKHYYGE